MFGAIIPGTAFHTRDEIQRMQDAIQRKAVLIDNSATSCAALDQNTLTSWRLNGYIPAQQFANQDPPSTLGPSMVTAQLALNQMFEAGIALQQHLDQWVEQLRSYGCNVPIVLAEKPWSDVISAAKWVGGTLVVLGILGVAWKGLGVVEKGEELL